MLSKTDLASVNECKATSGQVLSIYLDIDQSKAENLNRKFEATFESKIQELARAVQGDVGRSASAIARSDKKRQDFDICVAEARKVLAAYEPHARGLVIFARPNGSIWMRELNVPITTEI